MVKVIRITPHPECDEYESLIMAWPEQQADISHYLKCLAEREAERFLRDHQDRTITVGIVSMRAEDVLDTVEFPSEALLLACEQEIASRGEPLPKPPEVTP